MTNTLFTCAKCGVKSCAREDLAFPQNCVSVKAEENSIHADAIKEYTTNEEIKKITYAAASVESEYYCKAPRVEEIVRFARKMGYKKIGIATCIGLIEETKLFAKVLEAADLVPYGVICKVGRVDKPQIGIPEEWKIHPGGFEAMCNPILQAMMLNKEETDINVIVGLCVGHDILFTKYSEAPVTTLIVKDRVMAHNPAGALHTLGTYNKRLLEL